MIASPITAATVAEALEAVRAAAPRVHCITNDVAQAYTANTLLALGAVPSMTIAPDEVGGFAEKADCLLVNLGTFDATRRDAVDTALPIIENRGRRWALDPAHAESSNNRATLARTLIGRRPAAMRCNPAEFATLTDCPTSPQEVRGAAKAHDIVIAVTAAADIAADPRRTVKITNGHPLQARVTAAGCAATAVVAAFLAAVDDPLAATVSALAVVGIAAEIAAETAAGPGSLQIGCLDELYRLTPDAVVKRVRLG